MASAIASATPTSASCIASMIPSITVAEKWTTLFTSDPELERGYRNFSGSPLSYACTHGRLDLLDICLELNPMMIWAKDTNGFYPIHYATRNGQLEAMRQLVDGLSVDERRKYIDVIVYSEIELTPLLYAVMNGYLEIIDQLMEWGATAFELPQRLPHPMQIAIRYKQVESLKCLLKWVRMQNLESTSAIDTICTVFHQSVMHAAAINNRLEFIDVLIRGGCKCIDMKNEHGDTPLHLAALRGHFQMVELLIQFGSKAINERTYAGTSVLGMALRCVEPGGVETALRLIALGATTHTEETRDPIEYAWKGKQVDEDDALKIRHRVYFASSLTKKLLLELDIQAGWPL